MAERHQVVIIGGGFGGLNAARGLTGPHLDVTLVDRTNHHLFQPLLYQVAAGILPPGLIAPALRSAVRTASNVRTLLADVHDIDLDAKTVHARAPDDRPIALPYDSLVVAAGATHSYFGKDHFAAFAPGMKTVEDARYLRDSILGKFEMAELTVSLGTLPGVAQPAIQEGKYVAKVIEARLAGDGAWYFDKGSMATIGYRAAVADAFGMKFTGLVAYVMWMFVHMLYLIGWGNRLGTIYTWLRALVLSNNRGHRIITFEQVSGRLHEETSGTRAILPHGKEV